MIVYLLVLLGRLASAKIVQNKHDGYFVDWNGSPRLHEYKEYKDYEDYEDYKVYDNGFVSKTYDFGNGTREVKVIKFRAEIPGTTSVKFIVVDTYDDDHGTPEWINPNYYLEGSIGYNGQRMGKWSKNAAEAGAIAEPFWNGQRRTGKFYGYGGGYDEYPDAWTRYEEDMQNNGWRRVIINKRGDDKVFWTVEETFGHVTNGAVPDWARDENFSWKDLGFRGEKMSVIRRPESSSNDARSRGGIRGRESSWNNHVGFRVNRMVGGIRGRGYSYVGRRDEKILGSHLDQQLYYVVVKRKK